EDYDGAEPSATSVSVLNLLTLSHLTSDEGFEHAIARALGMFASRIEQGARTVPMMMAALSTYHAGISQVLVTGDPAAAATRALNEVISHRYLPFAITIPLVPEHDASLTRLLPCADAMARRGETPPAYVLRHFACLTPATSADDLVAQLESGRT